MAEYARTIPFLLIEHFVGSLLGIIILAPGYKASFYCSFSSSAEFSWIIFLMSKVVSWRIFWLVPETGSTFICSVTCYLHCLKSVLTSRFFYPMNWGVFEFDEGIGTCWLLLILAPLVNGRYCEFDLAPRFMFAKSCLRKFPEEVDENCFFASGIDVVDGGRKFC